MMALRKRFEDTTIPAPKQRRSWRQEIRRNPAVSAWPFVVVILAQLAVAGFSVYALSATRAYVTGESLWSKGQHEAVYFLTRYLDTRDPRHLASFDRAIAIPLVDRQARQFLEAAPADPQAAAAALERAGNPAADVPRLVWTFQNFRGFPYLEEAVARWKEADQYVLELDRLAAAARLHPGDIDTRALRDRVEEIDKAITPRAIAFAAALNEGARVVETLLMVLNFALAGALAAVTIWRVSKFLAHRREIEGELSWQALHDELTGLTNRRGFEERLQAALRPGAQRTTAGCALLFIDLDQFKIVNDTCGHAAGDALLRRICPPMRSILGPDDLLARIGGDEFSILLPNADMARALAIAETLRAAVEQTDFVWQGRAFGVTASIGLVHDESGGTSSETMMRAADMACFLAKEKGRNRIQAHREEDSELRGRVREMNWLQRIHQALSEDRFCLYAQEIVPLGVTEDVGHHLELLLRLRDEDGSLVPPSSFLPAAERFGVIKLIDRWVVRSAFRTLAERRLVRDAGAITRCGINLSGATIGDDTFPAFLREAFAEFGIAPQTICFEITETSAIVNLDAARVFVQDLREFGCTFALDDFGSGMSSFNYLKELPVDFLKIDGGFVKNLLVDRADRAMVEMINHVGHIMGKRIIAEFVETRAIVDALRDIGVDYGQGYGLSPPKPFDAHFTSSNIATSFDDRYERLIA